MEERWKDGRWKDRKMERMEEAAGWVAGQFQNDDPAMR